MAIHDIPSNTGQIFETRPSTIEYSSNKLHPSHQGMIQVEPCAPKLDRHLIIADHPPRDAPLQAAHMSLREHPASSLGGSSNSSNTSKEEYGSEWCLCQPDAKTPRPRNAFIIYRQYHQAAVRAENPDAWNQEISKIIGRQWKNLSADEQNKWRKVAEQEKLRHAKKYPTYRYRPKRAGGTGNTHGPDVDRDFDPSRGSLCVRCGHKRLNAPTSIKQVSASGVKSKTLARVEGEKTTSGSLQEDEEEMRPISTYSIDRQKRAWPFEKAGTQNQPLKRLQYSNTSEEHRNHHYHQGQQQQQLILPPIILPLNAGTCLGSSLKLAPLKPPAPRMTPSKVIKAPGGKEKYKILDERSPNFQSFSCQTPSKHGSIIAIDGQDPSVVQCVLSYLGCVLEQEGKHCLRIFQGPIFNQHTAKTTFDPKVEYSQKIATWNRLSQDIRGFVNTPIQISCWQTGTQGAMDNGTKHPVSIDASPTALSIALVSQYKGATPDALSCLSPMQDVYTSFDHWKLMSGLWQSCVSPDITLYIRECGLRELEGSGLVTTRLQEDGTITIWRLVGSPEPLEKHVLESVGTQIMDFLLG